LLSWVTRLRQHILQSILLRSDFRLFG